jgi:hypothetical protein
LIVDGTVAPQSIKVPANNFFKKKKKQKEDGEVKRK